MTKTHITLLRFSECVLGPSTNPMKGPGVKPLWPSTYLKYDRSKQPPWCFLAIYYSLKKQEIHMKFYFYSFRRPTEVDSSGSRHTSCSLFTCCADSLICPESAGIWRKANSFQFCLWPQTLSSESEGSGSLADGRKTARQSPCSPIVLTTSQAGAKEHSKDRK